MKASNKIGGIIEGLDKHRVEKLDEGKIKVGDKVQVEGFTGIMTVTDVSNKGISIEGITGIIPEKKVKKYTKN